MARTRDYMTIGELVESLQPAHPDLTISKVRFLEDEGLVTPERTAGGYRKFSSQDAARVDLVLRLQKEHFLPLAVIREKLKDLDKGRVTLEAAQSTMGLPVTFVRELAEFGLVRISKGDHGDELRRADVEVAHAAWDLRRFGVEARHLRTYVTAAEREAALFSQILMPTLRHRTPETRQKLVESIGELAKLCDELRRPLLKRALADTFEDVV
jgi:DNA-binding transcriptional MerR regulator